MTGCAHEDVTLLLEVNRRGERMSFTRCRNCGADVEPEAIAWRGQRGDSSAVADSAAELVRFADVLSDEADAVYGRLLASGELSASQAADLVLGPTDDCDASLGDIDDLMDLTIGIETLAPFGYGFTRPEIELVVDLAACSLATLGSDKAHLKIVLPIGMKVLWWNAAGRLADLRDLATSPIPGESTVRLRVTLSINVFRGTETVQAVVEQMVEPTEPNNDIVLFTVDDA